MSTIIDEYRSFIIRLVEDVENGLVLAFSVVGRQTCA